MGEDSCGTVGYTAGFRRCGGWVDQSHSCRWLPGIARSTRIRQDQGSTAYAGTNTRCQKSPPEPVRATRPARAVLPSDPVLGVDQQLVLGVVAQPPGERHVSLPW